MNDTKIQFEYTNSCTCQTYDESTDEFSSSEYCDGSCFDMMLEDFEFITSDLFKLNETGWWKITNLRLWDGNHSGFIKANNVVQLLRGMVVNSEWTLRGEILENKIHYSLSHHDAIGSSTTVTIVEESELELYGLE